MPKSKRNKIEHLTKAKSKGHLQKKRLMQDVRQCVQKYESFYVFSFHNLRTTHMKKVRAEFRDSRFFLGKNKLIQLALGRTPADEQADNLHRMSRHLTGHVGLFFTNRPQEEIEKYFDGLAVPDYPSAGFVPSETENAPAGLLEGRPVSMLEQLKALGMAVEIRDGTLVLRSPFCLCQQGKPITPEQAKALALYERKVAVFRLRLVCRWSDGGFEELEGAKQQSESGSGAVVSDGGEGVEADGEDMEADAEEAEEAKEAEEAEEE